MNDEFHEKFRELISIEREIIANKQNIQKSHLGDSKHIQNVRNGHTLSLERDKLEDELARLLP